MSFFRLSRQNTKQNKIRNKMEETDDTEIYGEHELYKANFNIYNYEIHASSHEILQADRYLQNVRQANNMKIKLKE